MSEANNPPHPTPGGARPPSTDDNKPQGGQKQMGEDDVVDPGPTNTTEPRAIPRDKPGGMEARASLRLSLRAYI